MFVLSRKVKTAAKFGLLLFVGLVAADILLPPPSNRAVELSPMVVDRNGRWMHAYTTNEGRWRFAADLDVIDPQFIERLIAVEDKRFYKHMGMDPLALSRAIVDAISKGRIRSGASTITMQTARLLEPRPRTIPSKAIEILRAVQIERRLNKREILELYLTLTPYGGNLEGVRSASLSYFRKEPKYLTIAEQALLIALPQAPEARRPDLKPENARASRQEILQKLVEANALGEQYADEASTATLPVGRQVFPRAAYHATQRLISTAKLPNEAIVKSTLDLDIQHVAENLAAAYADRTSDGATTALIVVDHNTMEVRASVGSSGLSAPGGWIDLTRAIRSPGSTLKPIIYALAFEDGIAGPNTVIDDMPRNFGDYSPENFDRTFRGEVRVSEALQHSLNLPAVVVLDRLGANRFSALLNASGVRLHGSVKRSGKKQGLAIALGGTGLTLQDLAVLYAGLANEGAIKPLHWTEQLQDAVDESARFQLFSAENANRVSAILREAPALKGRAPSALSVSAPNIAFKTGTSYGYRDAWAAGYAGCFTVVVWVGRADGAPRPGITGRRAAAPLLFDVFDALTHHDDVKDNSVPSRKDESSALVRLSPEPAVSNPRIIFPKNGVELYSSAKGEIKGFSLAARGGTRGYKWYVAGDPVTVDATSGRAIWMPTEAGFYDIVVVDGAGRKSKSKVRVHLVG